MEEFLTMLINTLNGIEVKGRDNLEKLFCSIAEAERKLAEIREEAPHGK